MSIFYVDFWPAGFLKVRSTYYAIDPRGGYSAFQLNSDGEWTQLAKKQLINISNEKMGHSSFGRVVEVHEISHYRWLTVQETGWTIYEVDQAMRLINEVVSSPIPAKFEEFVKVGQGQQVAFGIRMSNGKMMMVKDGTVNLIEATNQIFSLGDSIYELIFGRDGSQLDIQLKLLDMENESHKEESTTNICMTLVTFNSQAQTYFHSREGIEMYMVGENELRINGDHSLGHFDGQVTKVVNLSGLIDERIGNKYVLVVRKGGLVTILTINSLMKVLHSLETRVQGDVKSIYFAKNTKTIEISGNKCIKGIDLHTMNLVLNYHRVCKTSSSWICLFREFEFEALENAPAIVNGFLLRSPLIVVPYEYTQHEGTVEEAKEGEWIVVIDREGSFASRIDTTMRNGAEMKIIEEQLGNQTRDLITPFILYRLTTIMMCYVRAISNTAFDVACKELCTTCHESPEVILNIFDLWFKELDNEKDEENMIAGTIMIGFCVFCNDETTNEMDFFSSQVAEKLIKGIDRMIKCSNDRYVALIMKILTKLGYRLMRYVRLVDPGEFYGQILTLRSQTGPDSEAFDSCNEYMKSLFMQDPSFMIILLCSFLGSSQYSKPALEYLDCILIEQRSKITSMHLILIADALMQLPELADREELIDLTVNILQLNFHRKLCIHSNNYCLIFGAQNECNEQFGYPAVVLNASSAVYLENPLGIGSASSITSLRKILGLRSFCNPVFSPNGRLVAALDLSDFRIILYAIDLDSVSTSGKVNVCILQNPSIPLKVPAFDLVFLQLFWASENYNDRFLKTKLSQAIARYQESRSAARKTYTAHCKTISIADIILKYLKVFKETKWKDIEIMWISNDKLALQLAGKIIFTYGIRDLCT
ncbi:hypothetical protein FOA43_002561 [Brettanomyces nanus]|uniref:Uncharacterized protein n=1 Tax=Eeniella nana TaxID=13502 RepID=A0A875S0A7_EENNA|nr:uncharacterized protein FOA43_002561 [Brettanomyces nanus]QPG75211.1 hypothetical protein FOA43_002561 [Brettanomyces nanus]